MKWWQRVFGFKASQTRAYMQFGYGTSTGMTRRFEDFSEEAYKKNVVAYRCINMVAASASQVSWYLKKKDQEIYEHAILDLLKRPNPMQGQNTFIENVFAFRLLSGNSFVESVGPGPKAPPTELWCVRPDRMTVVPGLGGIPSAYVYKSGGYEKAFPVDNITGKSQILLWKTFNPLDDWNGMSPVEAAVHSIDIFNEQGRHNFNLIKNGAVPSGIMKVLATEANPSGSLTDEQYQRMKAMIEMRYSGAENAAKPMLLEGGLEWQQMGMSPKDMDWINSKNTTARDIANAFGVPPMLVNIAGDNTYANYAEARLAMYEETIIPLLNNFKGELNNWLCPMFDKTIELEYNEDDIPAIADKRKTVFDTMAKADFLTVNEKREAVGYEAIPGMDVLSGGQSAMPEEGDDDGSSEEDQEESQEEGDQESNQESQEGDLSEVEKSNVLSLESKVFNLITGSEKRRHWAIQQEKRKVLSQNMAEDIRETLEDQANSVAKAIADTTESRLAEFAALEAIHKYQDELYAIMQKHYARVFKYFGDKIVDQAKSAGVVRETKTAKTKYEQAKKKFIKEQTAEKVSLIQSTTEKKVRNKIKSFVSETLEEGYSNQELSRFLKEELTFLSDSRARTIARTEVAAVSINSEMEAVKALDIPDMQKEWVSVRDARSRDDDDIANHYDMNGKRVGLNEKFHVEPDADMDGPLDPTADASQIINCRCALVYTRGN